jgi:hypothetical protein
MFFTKLQFYFECKTYLIQKYFVRSDSVTTKKGYSKIGSLFFSDLRLVFTA